MTGQAILCPISPKVYLDFEINAHVKITILYNYVYFLAHASWLRTTFFFIYLFLIFMLVLQLPQHLRRYHSGYYLFIHQYKLITIYNSKKAIVLTEQNALLL